MNDSLAISAMNTLPKHKMTVDEYLAWAEGRPGRYELYAGSIYAMEPAGAGHAETKFLIQRALLAGIKKDHLPCHMLPNGITVRVDEGTAHEPDALVYCGEELPDDALEAPNPVIVVEVLSPSTRHIDASAKRAGYFRVPSVQHFLIVDPDQRFVIHHARGERDMIATRIVREGALHLAPPGIEIALADIFPASSD
jgi:Uma2 family endonuclease